MQPILTKEFLEAAMDLVERMEMKPDLWFVTQEQWEAEYQRLERQRLERDKS